MTVDRRDQGREASRVGRRSVLIGAGDTGTTPDAALEDLQATTGSSGMDGMHGMHGMGEAMQSPLLGGAGDVAYPHYLVNGRTPGAPATLTGKPGQRVRIRIINAGSDTAFRLAIGGHRLIVTHSDGFPVEEQATDALLIGMGERYDVVVTLADGAVPLVASAEGKAGQGLAVVRAGSGRAPRGDVRVAELDGEVLPGTDLVAREGSRLPSRAVDWSIDLVLGGTMAPLPVDDQRRRVPRCTPAGGHRGRTHQAALREPHHDVPPHAPAWPYLWTGPRRRPQGHHDRAADADRRGRLRRDEPGAVGDSLPQPLSRRVRNDDDRLLPDLTAWARVETRAMGDSLSELRQVGTSPRCARLSAFVDRTRYHRRLLVERGSAVGANPPTRSI